MRHLQTPWRAAPTALAAWCLLLPSAMAQQAPDPASGQAPATVVGQDRATPEPVAPVATPEPVPDALTLIQRALAAHKALGPATIVTTMAGTFEGQPMTITVTNRRNDATHFAATARAKLGLVTLEDGIWQWYRNGTRQLYYDASENTFTRSVEAGPFPPDLTAVFFSEVDTADLTARKGPNGSGPRVENGEIEGLPAWQVVIPGTPARGRTPASPESRLVFGREDALLRAFRFAENGDAFDVTVAYTPSTAPFPESTFTFTPPAGAKEIKVARPAKPAAKSSAKKPVKKAPPRKPPAKAPPSRLPRR